MNREIIYHLKKLIKYISHLFAILLLTILSQIGGLIYILGLLLSRKLSTFKTILISLVTYLLFTFLIVPALSGLSGRQPLPLSGKVAPLNFLTVLLNRHYVDNNTYKTLLTVAEDYHQVYPSSSIHYLDANFPFINRFPLIPHLSHSDGKKLDLAFSYNHNGNPSTNTPSILGYGYYESPEKHEINAPENCKKKGFWQYGIISKFIPFVNDDNYQLDIKRTKTLIRLLALQTNTQKIFIEPHLKKRWGLSDISKIRFHGCHAVRHDDHIHWQTF